MDGNEKLKELLKLNPENMTDSQRKEFLGALGSAELLLPVDITGELDFTQKDLGKEFNPDEPINFSPIMAKQPDGLSFLPIFTDLDAVDEFGQHTVVSAGCREIAALMVQSEGVNAVVINPGSKHSIGIDANSFLEFVSNENLKDFEKIVSQEAKPLKTESRFYLREDVPLMHDTAVDGIYTSKVPFNASFRDNYTGEKKYLNILIIPKGVRFLYIGDGTGFGDSMFPPVIKFKLIEEKDNTFTWQCISQTGQVMPKKNKIVYLIVVLLIIIAIISFLILR